MELLPSHAEETWRLEDSEEDPPGSRQGSLSEHSAADGDSATAVMAETSTGSATLTEGAEADSPVPSSSKPPPPAKLRYQMVHGTTHDTQIMKRMLGGELISDSTLS